LTSRPSARAAYHVYAGIMFSVACKLSFGQFSDSITLLNWPIFHQFPGYR
jgi:hypothetical protein